mgnify:CR=1 FL=1
MDKDFKGEAWAAKGAKVGYLAQEPHLDPALTVKENVMLGVAGKTAILERYNELAMNYSDETAEEMGKLQDEIDAQNLWELEASVGVAMDALRCPPGDQPVDKLSGGERRRVALALPRRRHRQRASQDRGACRRGTSASLRGAARTRARPRAARRRVPPPRRGHRDRRRQTVRDSSAPRSCGR